MIDRDDGYCRANFIGTHTYVFFVDIITPLIALILNFIAVKYRYSTAVPYDQKAKHITEIRLLYISFFSTVCFTTWAVLTLVAYKMTPM